MSEKRVEKRTAWAGVEFVWNEDLCNKRVGCNSHFWWLNKILKWKNAATPKIYNDQLEFLFVVLLASLASFLNPGESILAVRWVFLAISIFWEKNKWLLWVFLQVKMGI